MSRRFALGLTGLVLAAGLAQATLVAEAASPGFRPIPVTATPIDSFGPSADGERYGALEFRGGLTLASDDRLFGSLSGLDFASDGTLFAVSDRGRWFAAHPEEADGRLVGLADTRIAPILNHGGVPLSGKRWGDAEALRIVPTEGGDTAYVTFERANDLRAFAGDAFALAGSRPVTLPASLSALKRNGGLEAAAVARQSGPHNGALILIAEHFLDDNENHRAWIVGGPQDGEFSIVRDTGYDVTDATSLPNGDLLILERGVRFPLGIFMRIRRIAEADITAGSTVNGDVLIEADLRHQIDNMEGIAVRTNDAGETIIALVSDDNNSPLQRTVLLYFTLIE